VLSAEDPENQKWSRGTHLRHLRQANASPGVTPGSFAGGGFDDEVEGEAGDPSIAGSWPL
jgi:hypothetical protein